MYYITPKNSETGKLFTELQEKFKANHAEKVKLAHKYGFKQWTEWSVGFTIASVAFEKGDVPDSKLWAPCKSKADLEGTYKPNRRTKAGKDLEFEIQSLRNILPDDINYPVLRDMPDSPWSTIGFSSNETHFGYITPDKWEYQYPADCEEVTSVKYKEMFPDKK